MTMRQFQFPSGERVEPARVAEAPKTSADVVPITTDPLKLIRAFLAQDQEEIWEAVRLSREWRAQYDARIRAEAAGQRGAR